MKEEITRDVNVLKLYDLFLNYLYFKDYPGVLQDDVKKLYLDVLEYMKEEENHNNLDIKDLQYYYVETGKSGNEKKHKLNEDYFLLDTFLSNYINNKYGSFSNEVIRKVEELQELLQKELPDDEEYLEDATSFKIVEEIEYENN